MKAEINLRWQRDVILELARVVRTQCVAHIIKFFWTPVNEIALSFLINAEMWTMQTHLYRSINLKRFCHKEDLTNQLESQLEWQQQNLFHQPSLVMMMALLCFDLISDPTGPNWSCFILNICLIWYYHWHNIIQTILVMMQVIQLTESNIGSFIQW